MVTDEILAAYLAGDVSAEERERMEQILAEDPAALADFLGQLRISMSLHALLGGSDDGLAAGILATTQGLSRQAIAKKIIRVQKRRTPLKKMLALAAVLTLGAFGIFNWQMRQPLARVGRTTGAKWSLGDWKEGDSLRRGLLQLDQGVVEIRLSKGAIAVVEAPATFQITGNNRIKLIDGKLSANVPPAAHGFTVDAAGFSVVDHGTEFGVVVSRAADGSPESEVHVSEGGVVVKAKSEADRPLVESEALRISAGSVESIPEQSEKFTGKSRLNIADAGAVLAADPAALVHFDFEGVLQNRSVAGQGIVPVVSGCQPTEGRWPGKGALAWKSAEDRVRFAVPGELRAITLAAWVRFDARTHLQTSLLMSESELPGDVHWYVWDGGQLGFAVIGSDGEWHQFMAPTPLSQLSAGKWSFLVTTFDGSTVSHYLDGVLLTSQPLIGIAPMRLGTVELGNWGVTPSSPVRASEASIQKHNNRVRNLSGRMDHFTLLAKSLTAGEVRDLYQKTQAPLETPSLLSQ